MKPVYNWTDTEGGAVVNKWTYDMYHTFYKGVIMNESDGATGNAGMLTPLDDLDKEADAIDAAVDQVLKDGFRTGDIYSEGCTKVGCKDMGKLIVDRST